MITDVYAHILDEDRKINAQKFESAFYTKTDLRNVAPPQPQVAQATVPDIAALVAELSKSPELLASLTQLLATQNQTC